MTGDREGATRGTTAQPSSRASTDTRATTRLYIAPPFVTSEFFPGEVFREPTGARRRSPDVEQETPRKLREPAHVGAFAARRGADSRLAGAAALSGAAGARDGDQARANRRDLRLHRAQLA